ncbi:MAG TPA: hypothetical protein VMS22_09160 [Candidatus Eisenbacteria bacterium]|nr:hypothetical protein [Candidatus Eisenbacteria bacterium]
MKRPWSAVLFVAILVAEPAAADVLCRARNGRVIVRTSCKKREATLDFPKGPPGDAGAATAPPVRIVDAAGVPVGLFAEPANEDDTPSVLFEAGGQVVTFLIIGPAGFDQNGFLYHMVPHCADAGLVFVSRRNALVREGNVVGTTGYYAGDPVESRVPASREKTKPGAGCGADEPLANGNCCEVAITPIALDLGPAMTVFDIPSLGLTLPLRIEP